MPVAGVPQTLETVQQRRSDPQIGEMQIILNGSRGYFDAGRLTATLRPWNGLSGEVAYWFSKSLSLGEDHLSTATNQDGHRYYSPSQFGIQDEMKGRSSFDQPHSFMLRGTYAAPRLRNAPRWLDRAAAGWNLGAVALVKSGTPFHVQAGGDAPGLGTWTAAPGTVRMLRMRRFSAGRSGIPTPRASCCRDRHSAFMQPTDTRGNLGWNMFRKSRIANLNASLWRTFSFRRRASDLIPRGIDQPDQHAAIRRAGVQCGESGFWIHHQYVERRAGLPVPGAA